MFDADDYDSDNDSAINDVSDSGSGRNRRKPSVPDQLSLSFVMPKSTKQRLLTRDNFRCWLCEFDELDILEASHNVSAASQAAVSTSLCPPLENKSYSGQNYLPIISSSVTSPKDFSQHRSPTLRTSTT